MNEARYREAERRLWDSVGLAPTEKRVHLAQSDCEVRVQEIGEGPPVLFVHGASNSGTSWADLVVHLPGYRCVLLDRPGCGLSARPTTGFDDLAVLQAFSDALVVDVLEALEIELADIVATSYGGYSALRAAANHPGRIRKVVVLGWTLGADNPALPWFMRLGAVPALGRVMAKMPVTEKTVRAMFKRIGLRGAVDSGRVSHELVSAYTALLRHTPTMRNELEIGRWAMTFGGMNPDLVLDDELLGRIEAPVYLLWGEDDPFGPPEVARSFARRIPGAELELMPDAGHAVWIDDPQYVAKAIDSFLSPAEGGDRFGHGQRPADVNRLHPTAG